MAIQSKQVKAGLRIQSWDDEIEMWVTTEVTDVVLGTSEPIHLKDIDPKSEYQGMQWTETIEAIEDVELYRHLNNH